MRNSRLHEEQMSEAAFVDRAADWSKAIASRESRGPGDLENAMRRIEARYGIPYGVQWALRYRKPKGILASIYARIHAAYCAECERQMRKLSHELEITRTIAGPDHAAVVAAAAVVGATDRERTEDT